jgi:hypothetical protein
MSHFSFSSSTKLENKRMQQILPGEGVGTSGGVGERIKEGEYGTKKRVHMYVNAKMMPVETISVFLWGG